MRIGRITGSLLAALALANAVVDAMRGKLPVEAALAGHPHARDRATRADFRENQGMIAAQDFFDLHNLRALVGAAVPEPLLIQFAASEVERVERAA